jgi:hypothetical protein
LKTVVDGADATKDAVGSTSPADARALGVSDVLAGDVSGAVRDTGAAEAPGDGLGVWLSAVVVDP